MPLMVAVIKPTPGIIVDDICAFKSFEGGVDDIAVSGSMVADIKGLSIHGAQGCMGEI